LHQHRQSPPRARETDPTAGRRHTVSSAKDVLDPFNRQSQAHRPASTRRRIPTPLRLRKGVTATSPTSLDARRPPQAPPIHTINSKRSPPQPPTHAERNIALPPTPTPPSHAARNIAPLPPTPTPPIAPRGIHPSARISIPGIFSS